MSRTEANSPTSVSKKRSRAPSSSPTSSSSVSASSSSSVESTMSPNPLTRTLAAPTNSHHTTTALIGRHPTLGAALEGVLSVQTRAKPERKSRVYLAEKFNLLSNLLDSDDTERGDILQAAIDKLSEYQNEAARLEQVSFIHGFPVLETCANLQAIAAAYLTLDGKLIDANRTFLQLFRFPGWTQPIAGSAASVANSASAANIKLSAAVTAATPSTVGISPSGAISGTAAVGSAFNDVHELLALRKQTFLSLVSPFDVTRLSRLLTSLLHQSEEVGRASSIETHLSFLDFQGQTFGRCGCVLTALRKKGVLKLLMVMCIPEQQNVGPANSDCSTATPGSYLTSPSTPYMPYNLGPMPTNPSSTGPLPLALSRPTTTFQSQASPSASSYSMPPSPTAATPTAYMHPHAHPNNTAFTFAQPSVPSPSAGVPPPSSSYANQSTHAYAAVAAAAAAAANAANHEYNIAQQQLQQQLQRQQQAQAQAAMYGAPTPYAAYPSPSTAPYGLLPPTSSATYSMPMSSMPTHGYPPTASVPTSSHPQPMHSQAPTLPHAQTTPPMPSIESLQHWITQLQHQQEALVATSQSLVQQHMPLLPANYPTNGRSALEVTTSSALASAAGASSSSTARDSSTDGTPHVKLEPVPSSSPTSVVTTPSPGAAVPTDRAAASTMVNFLAAAAAAASSSSSTDVPT